MNDNYLIHGTNALKDALKYLDPTNPKEYTPESVRIFLKSACTTLKILNTDEKTISLLSERKEIYDTSDHNVTEFLDQFLIIDKALMVAAGMDKKMADYLFEDIESLNMFLKESQSASCRYIRGRIDEIAYTVCEESESNSFRESKPLLKRSICIIGGSAIFTTNLAADALLSGAASLISQGYGSHLFFKGIDG